MRTAPHLHFQSDTKQLHAGNSGANTRVKGLPTDAQCAGIWVTLHQLLIQL